MVSDKDRSSVRTGFVYVRLYWITCYMSSEIQNPVYFSVDSGLLSPYTALTTRVKETPAHDR